MPDVFTKQTHQGYFSKLANSLFGVLIGFLLVPGAILLISWNEYRTIHRTRGLLEAEQVVQEVHDPLEILSEQNGKLVHFSGQATTEETLRDKDFAVSQVALRLARDVEMYQWVEKKETRTRDTVGGGRETVTTSVYSKAWSTDRQPSESFDDASGHRNPPLRFQSQQQTARQASVGAFRLQPAQIEQLNRWQEVSLEASQLLASVAPSEQSHHLVSSNQLFIGMDGPPNPDSPQLGDLRIRFRSVPPMVISILGQQQGESVQPFRTSNHEAIESIDAGQLSSQEMFASLRAQNTALAWLWRGVGWLLACAGLALITGPLSAVASVLPFLGRIAGTATLALSVVLGSALALATIGLAWVAVRPLMGIGLIALAGMGLYWLMRKPKRSLAAKSQVA